MIVDLNFDGNLEIIQEETEEMVSPGLSIVTITIILLKLVTFI